MKIENSDQVAELIAERLAHHLKKGQKVLWLVPGGSSIQIAATVAKNLSRIDVGNLNVTLTDERFGPVGHPNSNWKQLIDNGFDLPGAQLLPVLTGKDIEQTTEIWSTQLKNLLGQTDYRLGFLGIGADGHTSGILPNSPAAKSHSIVCNYDDGQYQRLTTTGLALSQLDEAIVYAVGEPKRAALENLHRDMPINDQPAQLLNHIPLVTICNDLIPAASR